MRGSRSRDSGEPLRLSATAPKGPAHVPALYSPTVARKTTPPPVSETASDAGT